MRVHDPQVAICTEERGRSRAHRLGKHRHEAAATQQRQQQKQESSVETKMSAEDVANAFVAHYYQTRDTNVDALAGLFQHNSMMTFEGQSFQGAEAIGNKLKSVGAVRHVVKSKDIQPSTSDAALLIFVTGTIQIGGDNPLHFCEFFQLVSTGPNQYYVHNSIFRLNYGL